MPLLKLFVSVFTVLPLFAHPFNKLIVVFTLAPQLFNFSFYLNLLMIGRSTPFILIFISISAIARLLKA